MIWAVPVADKEIRLTLVLITVGSLIWAVIVTGLNAPALTVGGAMLIQSILCAVASVLVANDRADDVISLTPVRTVSGPLFAFKEDVNCAEVECSFSSPTEGIAVRVVVATDLTVDEFWVGCIKPAPLLDFAISKTPPRANNVTVTKTRIRYFIIVAVWCI